MRVVFDSNVLIAAFATRGLCHALFELCLQAHEPVVGEGILDEVAEKLKAKIKLPAAMVRDIRGFLGEHCLVERPVPVPPGLCRDPEDLAILGVAAASRAAFLVTGDADLLVLDRYHETEIVSPRALYDRLRRG